ncbi:5-hydroxytryptamine receptor 3A-like [Thalassophryne amazonica]|uniref:5-hydroxytryptamine receptor 3A-like n=1 Tax=Thalassophryne amazonica TaxID=390379 RepID=UPI001470BFB3|nr:5-hydroxytryptamine receptor 3A-like [Thalassophryne amazonica]
MPSPSRLKTKYRHSVVSAGAHMHAFIPHAAMMRAVCLILLILTGKASSTKVCSYKDVVDYLNLATDNDAFKLTRPVLDYRRPTVVQLDIILYAILAVVEKTQTFVPFIWVTAMWKDERISWDPSQFCGIKQLSFPRDMLWTPDLFINEMVEKDSSPISPYVFVSYDGTVMSEQDMKVVSTCPMDVHKFPFDTQKCTITIGSGIHSVNEMMLSPSSNSSRATQFSKELMKTQAEWDFVRLSVASRNMSYNGQQWDQLTYTFTVKRRPLLYVINFLLPILFFLSLDLASFFILDHRGEKLGFKVTILLGISVLMLILNDILPSMSNNTPLIATYCIVIFALMLMSLLETILVTYLTDKDCMSWERQRWKNNREEKEENPEIHSCNTEEKSDCVYICHGYNTDRPHEHLSVTEEVNNSVQSAEVHVLLLILEQLKQQQKTLRLLASSKEGPRKPACWVTRINKVFYLSYAIAVSLFLVLLYLGWTV